MSGPANHGPGTGDRQGQGHGHGPSSDLGNLAHDDGGFVQEVHEEHADETEPWLISYADLMTLLFGLFALMFSFAKFDDDKATVKVDKALAKYFGQSVLSPSDAKSRLPKDEKNEKADDKGHEPGDFSGLGDQLKVEIDRAKISKDAKFKQLPDGFEINFISSLLFASGKAQLMPDAVELLARLGKMIKNTGIRYQIRVEGHTDDNPIHSPVFPSNWELSAARAATILRIFEENGFDPTHLMAIGYGSSRPAYPNRTPAGVPIPENQALNRRVIIKVVVPDDVAATDPEKGKEPILTAAPVNGVAPEPGVTDGDKPAAPAVTEPTAPAKPE